MLRFDSACIHGVRLSFNCTSCADGIAHAGLTLRAKPEVAALLDPTGALRRAGALNLDAVPVATSVNGNGTEWTPRDKRSSFRICWLRGRLYRKDVVSGVLDGYCLRYVSLANTRAIEDWLKS